MYRPNVCMVIINDKKSKVLMFHRRGVWEYGWQFPQGGIDKGEFIYEAMYRELKEEIGTNNVEVLDVTQKWIKYTFPDGLQKKMGKHPKSKIKYKGQKQIWFLLRLKGSIDEIHFNHHTPEFDKFKWVSIKKAPLKLIDFKQPSTLKAFKQFKLIK